MVADVASRISFGKRLLGFRSSQAALEDFELLYNAPKPSRTSLKEYYGEKNQLERFKKVHQILQKNQLVIFKHILTDAKDRSRGFSQSLTTHLDNRMTIAALKNIKSKDEELKNRADKVIKESKELQEILGTIQLRTQDLQTAHSQNLLQSRASENHFRTLSILRRNTHRLSNLFPHEDTHEDAAPLLCQNTIKNTLY
jgi:hypothetical protein